LKLMPICLLSIMSVLAQFSSAQSGTTAEPEANPGRPTVSTPATLTPVGYLQFENGALFAEDSTEFSKRMGTSQLTKLSVLPRLELFLQIEPLVTSRLEDLTVVHEGEVFVGSQGVLFAGGESRPTVAISYVRRVHASVAPELDIGTFRQSTSILLSDELHGFHFDTNGIVAEQIQGTVHRAQFGQTLTISHPVGKFTIFAGAVAFLATIRPRQRRREPLGTLLFAAKESGARRRVQSWTDQDVHSMGSLRRVYVPTAPSSLEGPLWTATLTRRSLSFVRCQLGGLDSWPNIR
jgi:hypothetical protein